MIGSADLWGGPAASILALVCGYPSPKRERVPLAMLEAYVDDSGRGAPPVFVMAGFVGYAADWAAFAQEWANELSSYPAVPMLKMNDAMSLKGTWGHIASEAQRDAKLMRLAQIICRHCCYGVRTVFHTVDYNRIMRGKIERRTDNPFYLSYFAVIKACIYFQIAYAISDRPRFTFDQACVSERAGLLNAHDDFVRLAAERERQYVSSATPIFENDEVVNPLQAADMLAWFTRRSFAERLEGRHYVHPALSTILASVRLILDEWDADRLMNFLKIANAQNRAQGKVFPYEVRKDGKSPRRKKKS